MSDLHNSILNWHFFKPDFLEKLFIRGAPLYATMEYGRRNLLENLDMHPAFPIEIHRKAPAVPKVTFPDILSRRCNVCAHVVTWALN